MTSRLVNSSDHVVDDNRIITKAGNLQSYSAPSSPFSAFVGMWGKDVAGNERMTFQTSMNIQPVRFPSGTRFNWTVTPDPGYSGINGYLHLDYGNYDNSPGTITPRQVNDITQLTVDASWTYNGNPASGMLCEMWLASAATPSGPFTKTHEVGFFPKLSPASASFVDSLPAVGPGFYVDSNRITWNVGRSTSATGQPYLVAWRPGHHAFKGQFLFRDYLTFLRTANVITGTEWFNGVAYGVEPLSGTARVTIDSYSVTYA